MSFLTAFNAVLASTPESVSARVTEAQGLVKKRDYIDWNKELWGEATAAQVGDQLREGMQIGTGANSWAEVTWPHVTARAWANSSYAVAPNRKLVYLSNGEMLFQLDKHRKDKSEYCIWTNLLQARIRGTTVLVQSDGETSKITVLEGTIDVLNRIDHSVLRLDPGVVYEVHSTSATTLPFKQSWVAPALAPEKSSISEKSETLNQEGASQEARGTSQEPTSELSLGAAKNEGASRADSLPNIVNEKIAPLPLFETTKTISSIYLIDAQSVLNEVLFSGFKNLLPSAALVERTLGGLISLGDSTVQATKLLTTNVIPIRVPVESSYKVGQVFSSVLALPAVAVTHWSPSGWIAQTALSPGVTSLLVATREPQGRAVFHASREVKALPILNLVTFNAGLPGGTSLPGATPLGNGNFLVNNSFIVSQGATILPGNLAAVVAGGGANSAVVANALLTNNTSIAGNTPGSTPSNTTNTSQTTSGLVASTGGLASGTTGLLGSTGGTTGLLGGTSGLLSETTHEVTSVAGTTLSRIVTLVNGLPVASTVVANSAVASVLNTLENTVGSVTGTVTGTLTGTSGTVSGLLGALSLKTTGSSSTTHSSTLNLGGLLKH